VERGLTFLVVRVHRRVCGRLGVAKLLRFPQTLRSASRKPRERLVGSGSTTTICLSASEGSRAASQNAVSSHPNPSPIGLLRASQSFL
jgi:hypothetical protein